jgi:hypothetical protein
MEQRVELSRELFVILRLAKHRGWIHFLTGDEPWFWLTIDYEQQWLLPGAERPARPGKMINDPKAMIVLFWSPLGFPVIQALPPKVTFTSEFFVDPILPHTIAAKQAGDPGRRLVLHMDNASPHSARLIARSLEENGITTNPHLAFSPNFALSYFFLFYAPKGQLSGCVFESPEKSLRRDVRSRVPSRRRHLREYFSNGKKDCSDASISMVPISTKIYDA